MIALNEDARYAGRQVLVLGGFGYIGTHVTDALLKSAAAVTVVTPWRERHEAVARRVEAAGARVVQADVRDRVAMREAVAGQEIVFNLSGRSGSVRSVEDPAGDLDVNCNGTLALIDAIHLESPAAKLVLAGSRLVYGATRALPVSENQVLAPLCPHGLHKATAERYLSIYAALHGLRATTVRITNPYGPGQPADRSAYGVINYLIHLALTGSPLPIYGDGAQMRDYVFIADVVRALLAVGAHPPSDGRSYNVGSGVGTRMIDAARLIIEAAGGGRVETRPWPPIAKQIETGDFVADIGRIRAEIGWTPVVTLVDGLHRTVAAAAARVHE